MNTNLIMAPLRGFTDAVYRNAYQANFEGLDEAVAPFVTSIRGRRIKPSHLKDLHPSDNRGVPTVPQILSNNPEEFICLANTLRDLGYGEINWNLGCPYPMVAKKRRGSGLLPHPDAIDRMLEMVLTSFPGRLSIKTRLGRRSAAEMASLIPVFNRYPLSRIMVHPRTGIQMYEGQVDLQAFANTLEQIRHPVVYNGDIRDVAGFERLQVRFPAVSGWMLGRGLIANPFLPEMIRYGRDASAHRKERFARFHDELVEGYRQRFSGPGHVLDRMKGFWRYFADGFTNGPKLLKQVRKSRDLGSYCRIVSGAIAGNGWK